eukprot:COSAG01_NODE_119_length_25410_cov_1333.312275_38_plen_344_part_00
MSGESSSLPHRISGGLSPASLILAAAVVGWLSVYQHSAAELLTVPVFEEDELGGMRWNFRLSPLQTIRTLVCAAGTLDIANVDTENIANVMLELPEPAGDDTAPEPEPERRPAPAGHRSKLRPTPPSAPAPRVAGAGERERARVVAAVAAAPPQQRGAGSPVAGRRGRKLPPPQLPTQAVQAGAAPKDRRFGVRQQRPMTAPGAQLGFAAHLSPAGLTPVVPAQRPWSVPSARLRSRTRAAASKQLPGNNPEAAPPPPQSPWRARMMHAARHRQRAPDSPVGTAVTLGTGARGFTCRWGGSNASLVLDEHGMRVIASDGTAEGQVGRARPSLGPAPLRRVSTW